MSITSEDLSRAFIYSFSKWGVGDVLKIVSVPHDQSITTTSVSRQKVIHTVARDFSKITIPDHIIVYVRSESSEFEEIHFVKEINFHAVWAGIENPIYNTLTGYEQYNEDREVGAENACVEIIGGYGDRLFRVDFGNRFSRGEMIQTIMNKIKLAKEDIPMGKGQGEAQVKELREILRMIRLLNVVDTIVDKRRFEEITARMEKFIGSL